MKETPSVAIIILNWNGYAHTSACLKSLQAAKMEDVEVILVDNASEDGAVAKLKSEFPQHTYLQNEQNLGFTGGNNVGIKHALEREIPYIMLLNNDTEVVPGFLGHLLHELKSHARLAAVQPLMYYLHDKHKVWNAGGKFNPWTGGSTSITQKKNHSLPYPTDWITGCCILVRSEVIREVGLLNDHYFAYFEDVDWSLRMRERGHGLAVAPAAVIYHEAGASSKAKKKGKEGVLSPKVHYLNTRNQLFQLRNHVDFPHRLVAWPVQLVKLGLFGVYFLVRRRREKFRALLKGLRDGLKLECKS
ncbi:glycosyltransferase family 2 protein [Echinicola soli]|uniref:glycosyltransferase family 2 protein n=1 Tax=Echinicola soli TaxID=2591634 RepID=UPI001E535014|nr:glycosyltransferase family 2 protein [Echinicola soli]